MDEFDQTTMEEMCDTIDDCLASGNCSNGEKLSGRAFLTMYMLASGTNPDVILTVA